MITHPILAAAPNWADIVTAIGSALAGSTLLVGAIGVWFAVQQLAESKCARHIEIITEMGRRWDDDKLEEARKLLLRFDDVGLCEHVRGCLDAQDDTEHDLYTLLRVPNFFEDLALMVEVGNMDPDIVNKAFGNLAVREWQFWSLAIDVLREDDAVAYSQFGVLASQLAGMEPV